MPKFYNPHQYNIELIGHNGQRIIMKQKSYMILPDYFRKYTRNNFIIEIKEEVKKVSEVVKPQKPSFSIDQNNKIHGTRAKIKLVQPKTYNYINGVNKNQNVVGRSTRSISPEAIPSSTDIRISNGVAVGILSYNRGTSLLRCVESLKKFTNINKVTVFISDDGSDDDETLKILEEISKDSKICVIRNEKNAGISCNSNRLLRCMSRFDDIFLCNDDVEFLSAGWEDFYVQNSKKSDLHHLCYRQVGIYGAGKLKPTKIKEVPITIVRDKPHGAFLYISKKCLDTVGYFDSDYQNYGMEHVDWSMKPHEFGLQPSGFIDFHGSDQYIKIYNEKSSCKNKSASLRKNKAKFENRKECTKLKPCEDSQLPSISYVVPCRLVDRLDSIKTVISCIIGQSFPVINVHLVEQDASKNLDSIKNVNYHFSKNATSLLFNKSQAFNLGVKKSVDDSVILHDADMIMNCGYTKSIYEMLLEYDSVHLSSKVLYLDKESTNRLNISHSMFDDYRYERLVDYFEGGSLACKIKSYWDVGGFNEDFKGYGVEDCDFYYRLSNGSKFLRSDDFNLVHLWHSRQDGWASHHEENKLLGGRLSELDLNTRISMQKEQLKRLGHI